jgi:hypothetical protein
LGKIVELESKKQILGKICGLGTKLDLGFTKLVDPIPFNSDSISIPLTDLSFIEKLGTPIHLLGIAGL